MPIANIANITQNASDALNPDGSIKSNNTNTTLVDADSPPPIVDNGDEQGNKPVDTGDDTNVSLDDFDFAKGLAKSADKKDDKKANDDDTKVVDDKTADDDKKDDKVVDDKNKVDDDKVVDDKVVIDPTKQNGKIDKTAARDYSDIPAELVPHFKTMSNNAFATLKPLVLRQQADIKDRDAQIVKLKEGGLPDNYYEHENGYVLTPQFESAANAVNESKIVLNHWESQLEAVREGATKYQMLTRNAEGRLAYGAEVAADSKSETTLQKLFTGAHAQYLAKQAKMESIQENHATIHKQSISWIGDFQKKAFPAFFDETNPRYDKTLNLAVQEFVNRELPAHFRANPLATLFGTSFLTNMKLFEIMKTMKAGDGDGKAGVGNGKATPAKRRAGPTESDLGGDAGGGKGKGNEVEISMDDFKKVKEAY